MMIANIQNQPTIIMMYTYYNKGICSSALQ